MVTVVKSKAPSQAPTKAITPPLAMTVHVSIEKILPNPYQPAGRLKVDGQTAEKFGKSILEHGLLQTPVGRRAKENGYYEMGDGWLRCAGYRWLVKQGHQQYLLMPLLVRDLTDRQMADLALEANLVRQDFTPIDLARFYKKYLEDFKVTQEELARSHNISQGELSNTIRLLELPEDIQGKIISQEISQTHARQLLRLKDLPEEQKKLADDAIKYRTPVNALSDNIANTIYRRSMNLDPSDNYSDKPLFDLKPCAVCPSREKLGRPYSHNEKTWRCLKPECWKQKQGAAREVQKAGLISTLKAQGITKLYGRNELPYGDYKDLAGYNLDDLDKPSECQKCPKRAAMESSDNRDGHDGHGLICTDLRCYRSKQLKHTKDANARAREKENKLTEQLGSLCKDAGEDLSMKIVAELLLRQAGQEARMDVVKTFRLPVAMAGKTTIKELSDLISFKTREQLVRISLAALLNIWRREKNEPNVLRLAMSRLDGKSAELDKESQSFREKHCLDCHHYDLKRYEASGSDWCWYSKNLDYSLDCRQKQLRKKEEAEVKAVDSKSLPQL